MSSTEPPSRNAPRSQPHETKSVRDEFSSKGKVEKVREVDPDEQAKKQRFQKFYQGEKEETDAVKKPSPFDLYSQENMKAPPPPSFDGVENAIVPTPRPPPPNVNRFDDNNYDDESTEGALPHSSDFWGDVDLPDQPNQKSQFQENQQPSSSSKASSDAKHVEGKTKKKKEALERIEEREKKGQEEILKKKGAHLAPSQKETQEKLQRQASFEEGRKKEQQKPSSEIEETPFVPPTHPEEVTSKTDKKKKDQVKKETETALQPTSLPQKQEETISDRDSSKKSQLPKEIELPSLTPIPQNIQHTAMVAANQAQPFLSPSTVPLFFQMVGTMYVMTGTPGVSRTEIILNNPSFSASKFFGSTITIEKYATAPDSFNVRLSGTPEAVAAFRENIPSLMNAFQNGNYAFRVTRIDAELRTDRPVFRRKERESGQRESGGGDLGERRK